MITYLKGVYTYMFEGMCRKMVFKVWIQGRLGNVGKVLAGCFGGT